jgi:hypothetical protein
MEFAFEIGPWALVGLITGSVAIGVVFQLIGEASFGYEWVLTALGAGVGAFVASEFAVGLRNWQPVFDGLALGPAVIAGLVVGGLVVGATRYVAGGRQAAHHAI